MRRPWEQVEKVITRGYEQGVEKPSEGEPRSCEHATMSVLSPIESLEDPVGVRFDGYQLFAEGVGRFAGMPVGEIEQIGLIEADVKPMEKDQAADQARVVGGIPTMVLQQGVERVDTAREERSCRASVALARRRRRIHVYHRQIVSRPLAPSMQDAHDLPARGEKRVGHITFDDNISPVLHTGEHDDRKKRVTIERHE